MKSIVITANTDALDEVQEFIDTELEELDCPMKAQLQIDMAVEEIFLNIASYAYHPVEGEAEIRIDVEEEPMQVIIQFLDNGTPFDPLDKEDAATDAETLEEREGGLGILMVKSTMDDVSYRYEQGKNILTIRKNLED